jgi:hypothetical protein
MKNVGKRWMGGKFWRISTFAGVKISEKQSAINLHEEKNQSFNESLFIIARLRMCQ